MGEFWGCHFVSSLFTLRSQIEPNQKKYKGAANQHVPAALPCFPWTFLFTAGCQGKPRSGLHGNLPGFSKYAALREQAATSPFGNADTQSSPVLYLTMIPVNF
jgi:hypothetical protein